MHPSTMRSGAGANLKKKRTGAWCVVLVLLWRFVTFFGKFLAFTFTVIFGNQLRRFIFFTIARVHSIREVGFRLFAVKPTFFCCVPFSSFY